MLIADTLMLSYIVAISAGIGLWALLKYRFPLHSSEMLIRRREAADRKLLMDDLSAALTNDDIYLAYQPKLQLRTGTIEGVEALLRWRHPTLGVVAREVLIPLAEREGRIRELTIWVLRRALRDQDRVARQGHDLAVHINVSAGLLTDAAFVREVCALTGTLRGVIGLEITETASIENSALAMTNLKRLIDQGIAISIDDYGAGMSSLAYLKELPASELKIDKMFISGMTTSHRDPLIVRSTIDLAHALGLRVVAEGVESQAALALLRVMGCDFAQGFLISPALTVDALVTFLAAGGYKPDIADGLETLVRPHAFWTRTVREPRTAAPISSASG